MSYVPQPYNAALDTPVSYAEQTLTSAQKTQAKKNLGIESIEVWDDFTLQPDGDITNAATGQPYLLYPSTGNSKPRIVSGKLTFASGATAGYASVELAEPVTYMQCRFTLSGGSTDTGVIGLIPWVTDIGLSIAAGVVAQTPAHLIVGPTRFILGTFDGGDTNLDQNYSRDFATALATDGTTVHSVEMWIDSKRGWIIVKMPDGVMQVLYDEKYKVPARFACIEPYRYVPATDPLPAFISWSASSDPVKLVEGIDLLEQYTQHSEYYPSTDQSVTLSATNTEIVGTRKLFVVPNSGKVLVTTSLFLDITSDGLAVVNIGSGNTMFANVVLGSKVSHSGWATIQKVVDLSSFKNQTIQLALFVQMFSGAGTVTIHQGGSNAMPAIFRMDAV